MSTIVSKYRSVLFFCSFFWLEPKRAERKETSQWAVLVKSQFCGQVKTQLSSLRSNLPLASGLRPPPRRSKRIILLIRSFPPGTEPEAFDPMNKVISGGSYNDSHGCNPWFKD